jgi:hypothetical protein
VAAPTNVVATTRDSDSNGSVDTVRLTFSAARTGLQTASGATVRRFPVVGGVVGSTPTDVVTSWAYTSGTTGQVELKGADYPPIGSYVYQVAVKGVTGSSFSPFSASSNTLQITNTGLATKASAPIAVSTAVSDAGTAGLSVGDVITVTFNEPVQLVGTPHFIEIEDSDGDRGRLQSGTGANATFSVGGVDNNVLTITVTGLPLITNGALPVTYNATTTFIHTVSTTFRDRQGTSLAWNPTPSNTLGVGGAPLGVSRVASSTPVAPFTLTADTSGGSGTITLNHVTDVITGAANAAVPGATVFVSTVAGTGGTGADAVTATRKQAVAAANGSFSISLTSATEGTEVRLTQEVQRTAATTLASAASALIAAQPTLLATSAFGADGDGEMEDGDTIELRFSKAMSTADTAFDVSVSSANPNVVTITRAGQPTQVVATITTTGVQYNTSGTMTFAGSAGVWSDAGKLLTITLANRTGTAATGVGAHTSSYVAGAYLLDANGVAIDATPVTGASSSF